MGYFWKIQQSTIDDLKIKFDEFAEGFMSHVRLDYNRNRTDASYYNNKDMRENTYLSASELGKRASERYEFADNRYNKRVRALNELKEKVDFLLSVIEFTTFDENDFGHVIKFNFFEATMNKVKDATVPSNTFMVEFSGFYYEFDSFNKYYFKAEKAAIKFDRYYK